MPASPNVWASQAAQDTLLRYNPQVAALGQLVKQARENYASTVAAGRTTAAETERSASAAIPQIQQAYGAADSAQRAGATLVNQQLANLPGVADQYKADQASEVQQQLANLASGRANAVGMMTAKGVQARAGAQFNQLNAQQALSRELAQLFGKRQTISEEAGAYGAAERDKLEREAQGIEQRERASQRTAATSRANSQETRAVTKEDSERQAATSRTNTRETNATRRSTAKGSAEPKLSLHDQNQGAGTFTTMLNLAKPMFAGGASRGEVLAALTEDQPGFHTKTAKGQTISVPGRKGYTPNSLMAAALDAAGGGGWVTPHTAARLRSEGYDPNRLGVKEGKPVRTPGDFSSALAKALGSF